MCSTAATFYLGGYSSSGKMPHEKIEVHVCLVHNAAWRFTINKVSSLHQKIIRHIY
jgi:hypothetical protein